MLKKKYYSIISCSTFNLSYLYGDLQKNQKSGLARLSDDRLLTDESAVRARLRPLIIEGINCLWAQWDDAQDF